MQSTSIIIILFTVNFHGIASLQCEAIDDSFEKIFHPRFSQYQGYTRDISFLDLIGTIPDDKEPTCIISFELKHKTMDANSCDAMYKVANIKAGSFHPIKKKHFYHNPCVISDYYLVCICWYDNCNYPTFWWDMYKTVWLKDVGKVSMQLHKHLWTIFQDVEYEFFKPRRFDHRPYQGVRLDDASDDYPPAKTGTNRNDKSETANPMKCLHKLITLILRETNAFYHSDLFRGYATTYLDYKIIPTEYYYKTGFPSNYIDNTKEDPVYRKYKIPKVIPYSQRTPQQQSTASQANKYYEITTDADDYSYMKVYSPDGSFTRYKQEETENNQNGYDGEDYDEGGGGFEQQESIYTEAIKKEESHREIDTIVGILGILVFMICLCVTIFIAMFAWKTVSNFDAFHRRMTDARMGEIFDKALKNPIEKNPKSKAKGKKNGKGKKEDVTKTKTASADK